LYLGTLFTHHSSEIAAPLFLYTKTNLESFHLGTCNAHSETSPACGIRAKVGEVPTFRYSDTDTDLPSVSADLFGGL
jgi:hypothetical protein